MFTAAVFIINKNWKQTRCSSMDKFIHTMECYLALQRNELLVQKTKWMDLQGNMMSENSQRRVLHNCYYPLYIIFLKWHNYRNRKQISSCQGLSRGKGKKENGCIYKRVVTYKKKMFVVIEMLYNLTLSLSICKLWHCITVLQDVTIRENFLKHTESLIIS